METRIPLSEYVARRERVLEALDGAAAVVFAGEGHAPLLGRWRTNRHFAYLTGIENEPGAAVLFDPSSEDPDRRVILFLKSLDPEAEQWDGFREPISEALREGTGFATVSRAGALPASLSGAARRAKKLACLHPFATYPSPVSPDLAVYRQVSERVPGVATEDKTGLLTEMRAAKSPAELEIMRAAIAATADGFAAAVEAIRPGATEGDVADALGAAYRRNGGEHAFNPIVGGGKNAAILHYMDNNAPLKDGDLVLIDSGAAVGGYAADVTRTYPVGGKFTPEQRDLYAAVLEAEEAAIALAKPGAFLWELNRAARAVLKKAGYPDAFHYSVGHGLGMDVHEGLPAGPLRPGSVITVEPGVYLADRNLGIRIEDDVLITETGAEVLTAAIPKRIEDLERG